ARDDLAHRLAGLAREAAAVGDALGRGLDQRLDLPRGLRRFLRQRTHLARHDREALAVLARARGLDGGVEREDVGLERDAVDDAGDLGDALRAAVDALHGRDHARDHAAALLCRRRGLLRERARLLRGARTRARAVRETLHVAGRLLQAGRGALGAQAQVLVAV